MSETKDPAFKFTDRMLLSALLDVVGALAHRLTGEHPMVCLDDENGNILHATLGVNGVQWFKDPARATCCVHTEKFFEERRKEQELHAKAFARFVDEGKFPMGKWPGGHTDDRLRQIAEKA